MKPVSTDRSPFDNPPKIKEKIHWIEPKLVCEVEFAEVTADEQLRQTTFLGWRDDKQPETSCSNRDRYLSNGLNVIPFKRSSPKSIPLEAGEPPSLLFLQSELASTSPNYRYPIRRSRDIRVISS